MKRTVALLVRSLRPGVPWRQAVVTAVVVLAMAFAGCATHHDSLLASSSDADECDAMWREMSNRFTGEYVWLGAPLGVPPEVRSPEDVRYSFARVTKGSIDFSTERLKRIVLARHGETVANVWGVFQGGAERVTVDASLFEVLNRLAAESSREQPYSVGSTLEFVLTDAGRSEAEELGRDLVRAIGEHPIALFASPLRRATQTIDEVASAFGAANPEIQSVPDLSEAAAPTWEGKNGALQLQRHDASHDGWLADPYAHAPPDGLARKADSATSLTRRLERAIQSLAASEPRDAVAIAITHKGLLLWLLERYLGAMDSTPRNELVVTPPQHSAHWAIPVPNAVWFELFVFDGRIVVPDTNGQKDFESLKHVSQPGPRAADGTL